jgi:Ca2+-binding EF-hand superfamily protein
MTAFDKGSKGFLTKDEFHELLVSGGDDDAFGSSEGGLSQHEFDTLYTTLDTDSSGTLDLQEIIVHFATAQAVQDRSASALEGFNKDGEFVKAFESGVPLTPAEVQDFSSLFKRFDKDKSETLDPRELFAILTEIDGVANPKEIELALSSREIDNNGDRELDMSEFLTFMSVHKRLKQNELSTDIEIVEKDSRDANAKCWKNCLLIMFMTVPPGAAKSVGYFLCDSVEGKSYLRADVRQTCWTSDHMSMLPVAYVGVALYTLFFPMFFFVMLYRNKASIAACPNDHTSDTFRRLGFLYMAYKPESLYWDVFETYRRLLLGLTVSFVGQGTWLQIVYALAIMEMSVLLHCSYAPFKAADDNGLQFVAYIAYLITLFYGLMLRSQEAMGDMGSSSTASAVAFIQAIVIVMFAIQLLLVARKAKQVLPKICKAAAAGAREARNVCCCRKSTAVQVARRNSTQQRKQSIRRNSMFEMDEMDLVEGNENAEDDPKHFDNDATVAAAGVSVGSAGVSVAAIQMVVMDVTHLSREQLSDQFSVADEDESGRLDIIEAEIAFELMLKRTIDLDEHFSQLSEDDPTIDLDQFCALYDTIVMTIAV